MTVATFINSELGGTAKKVDAISVANGIFNLPFLPGSTASGDRLSDWVYVVAAAGFGAGTAVVDGTAVWLDKDFVATLAAGTTPKVGQFVGIIRFADTIATGNGFWVQICGQANVLVAASAAANTFLSTTTTAGVLGSAAGAGTTMKLSGITLVAANGGSQAAVEAILNYPSVNAAN